MIELARYLTNAAPISISRGEMRFRRRGSLAVCIAGERRGLWHDHEAGCGGDPLGLVAHLRKLSMGEALQWAQQWLNHERFHARCLDAASAVIAHADAGAESWSHTTAWRSWQDAVAAPGTLAERYLDRRGLTLPDDVPLRFHPRAWRNASFGPHGPAMVALMTDPISAVPVGVHLTYLRADGSGKADGLRPKVMLGTAGVIRLVPDDEVTQGLGVAEGIETALAVMQRIGWRPTWAATSAGAIARFPILAGITTLTIFADSDDNGVGLDAARRCACRWVSGGQEARVVRPPTGDWDDCTRCAR